MTSNKSFQLNQNNIMKDLITFTTLLILIIVMGACTSFMYPDADPETIPILASMAALTLIPPLTFQEYMNQKNPKRFPEVHVKTNDCKQIIYDPLGLLIVLEFKFPEHNYQCTYFKKPGDRTLWTMDNQGNPKERSVFKLISQT